jgi:hypothetical protein
MKEIGMWSTHRVDMKGKGNVASTHRVDMKERKE